MTEKTMIDQAEQFESLTIKKEMRLLANKAAHSKLYFKEIVDEFEKTLLQAILDKYDYNISKMSLEVKLHRNTIAAKMKKLSIKEKKKKPKLQAG